jgi:RNA polymerase sigma factor (sigma-70 family)
MGQGWTMLKPNRAIDSRPADSRATARDSTDLAHLQDQELLALYLRHRDPQAFGTIVARHGGMVLRTCFRLVGNVHDSEDAAQAVFLVLSRYPSKATGSLSGWLYKVARDTAITVLRSRARRARREEAAAMQKSTSSTPASPELKQELDHAIAGLPTRLREAVVVCHLEGRRQEEAARMLGCNQGTLSRRVADGLDRLRSILSRRGVMVTPAVLIAFLAEQNANAAVSASLLGGMQLTASGTTASTQAAALADATLRAATIAKLKIAAGVLLTAVVIGAGTLALWPAPSDRAVLVNFDGPTLPMNLAGNPYPNNHVEGGPEDGGPARLSLNADQAVAGNCLMVELLSGRLKMQFEADNGKHHTFAREQAADPSRWQFNTYNRMRFWIKTPAVSPPHKTNGDANMNVGTYARRVRNANIYSLSDAGTFRHSINVPALGAWTQVVLNAHPHVSQGTLSTDPLHPTGEPDFNYFDAMTRFYIEAMQQPARHPAVYHFDEIEFFREPNAENDAQVYSITATHIAAQNRLIVTWHRPTEEESIRYELRYAFRSIHEIGWDKAEPAPDGKIAPPGTQTRTGQVYDTTALPLAGQSFVYIAIKPESAKLFSQIAVPLKLR